METSKTIRIIEIRFGKAGLLTCLDESSPEDWILDKIRIALEESQRSFARRVFEEALDWKVRLTLGAIAKLAKEQGKVPKRLRFEIEDRSYRD